MTGLPVTTRADAIEFLRAVDHFPRLSEAEIRNLLSMFPPTTAGAAPDPDAAPAARTTPDPAGERRLR